MPSSARRVRRSQSGLRALVASLIAILGIGIVGVIPVAAAPAVPGPGYQDYNYKADTDTSTGGNDVTSFRNQSKLWFNDGRWWGILFDRSTAPNGTYRIQSLNMGTQTWTSGIDNVANPKVDSRNRAASDALWDGTNLYVASSHDHGRNWAPNGDLRLYKYSYNATTKTYLLLGGFPKTLATNGADPDPVNKIIAASGRKAATIAKDSDGSLWISYLKNIDPNAASPTPADVKFVHVSAAGAILTAETTLPTEGVAPTSDDMAAITTVGTSAGHRGVGILWSNQTAGEEAFYFSAHTTAVADTTWGARETAFGGSGTADADGHVSLKTDATGRVIAAVKTSRLGSSDPLIDVLARTGDSDAPGVWTNRIVSSVTQNGTRPVLVLDAENNQANVFITDTSGGVGHYLITRRTAPLSSLSFGSALIGTPFISSTADGHLSNVTSTKQITDVTSGIIALGADLFSRYYLHGCAGSVCPAVPVADFSGTPLTGTSPLSVQFTDASTGTPGTWAWDFGDGGTSALQSPSHVFFPGTFDVKLTVTNAAGTNTKTRAAYVTVAEPPGATYFPIAPVRRLDTRSGVGLSGAFHANVSRDFQVTNGTTIPNNAVAVTGNLTVTKQTKAGYIILAPSAGSSTSTLNFPLGDTRANGVTVALNAGKLNAVYKAPAGATTQILFDVTGYFLDGGSGDVYVPIAPVRRLDTRSGVGLSGAFHAGTSRDFQVTNGGTIPNNAVAVTGNLTVTKQTKAGYIILAPSAGSSTSTLNFPVGDTRANGVTVGLNAGKLNAVYKAPAGATTAILFDVTGYFLPSGSTGARFFAIPPIRRLDTRSGVGLSGAFHAGTSRDFQVTNNTSIPNTATAVTGNLTVTKQTKAGYIILAPSAGSSTSTLNFPVGDTRANGVTVALSGAGKLNAVYKAPSGATTQLLFDATGYFQ